MLSQGISKIVEIHRSRNRATSDRWSRVQAIYPKTFATTEMEEDIWTSHICLQSIKISGSLSVTRQNPSLSTQPRVRGCYYTRPLFYQQNTSASDCTTVQYRHTRRRYHQSFAWLSIIRFIPQIRRSDGSCKIFICWHTTLILIDFISIILECSDNKRFTEILVGDSCIILLHFVRFIECSFSGKEFIILIYILILTIVYGSQYIQNNVLHINLYFHIESALIVNALRKF